jgi:hypothetical protein
MHAGGMHQPHLAGDEWPVCGSIKHVHIQS